MSERAQPTRDTIGTGNPAEKSVAGLSLAEGRDRLQLTDLKASLVSGVTMSAIGNTQQVSTEVGGRGVGGEYN